MYRLVAEDVGKSFGERTLFSHLDLEIGAGDSLAVVGPNGAGKSTLLLILLGLIRPSSGRVRYLEGDCPLADEAWSAEVGFVAPYLQLYDQLSAEENLKFFASVSGRSITGKDIDRTLDLLGLAGRGGDAVGTYSSGMKQRLKYAVAVAGAPRFLVLDEPMSNLDIDGRRRVRLLVEDRRAETALILATSDDEEAQLASQQCRLG